MKPEVRLEIKRLDAALRPVQPLKYGLSACKTSASTKVGSILRIGSQPQPGIFRYGLEAELESILLELFERFST
jgi:hypothetical protein